MILYTNSIIKPRSEIEGIRISVMNRHTLNDGKTLDPRIVPLSYDEHLQVVSPPAKLLGDYYKRNLSWEDYVVRYLDHIRQPNVAFEVQNLALRVLEKNITLLCIEDSPEKCHRRLLAEECRRYQPSIIITHL